MHQEQSFVISYRNWRQRQCCVGGRRRSQDAVKTPTHAASVNVAYRCGTADTDNLQTQPDPLIPPEYWLHPAAGISLWMSPPSWYRTTFNSAAMPSLRHSYTVTVPEEPTAFPLDKHELQRKSPSLSRSKLVSTFMGLIINQAKVSPAPLHIWLLLCSCLTFTETPWYAFIMVTLFNYLFYLFQGSIQIFLS